MKVISVKERIQSLFSESITDLQDLKTKYEESKQLNPSSIEWIPQTLPISYTKI